eukprot:28595_3
MLEETSERWGRQEREMLEETRVRYRSAGVEDVRGGVSDVSRGTRDLSASLLEGGTEMLEETGAQACRRGAEREDLREALCGEEMLERLCARLDDLPLRWN